jgi:hypothetical protein
MVPKCMLSWLRRVCCCFFGIPIYVCGSYVCVCSDPRPVVAFSLSVVLPSQVACVCGSFDELNVLCVLISVPHTVFEYSMLLEKDNFTDWLSRRFPPLLRLYSFGIQETYIRDF